MLDTIKKHWFVILVGILFISASVYFAYDQTKDILRGKKVDGKDVVFEINGQNITADDFYEKLYDEMGISAIYTLFERAVIAQSAQSDKDLESEARIQANSTIENFKSYYGDSYEAVLLQAIRGVGYSKVSDLETYFKHLLLLEKVTKNHFITNSDTFYEEFFEKKSPRLVSHILVAMDDPTKPTEQEQARWDEVKEALASGKSFKEVAKEMSDDTGSAANDGSIGYMDSTSSLVPEFLLAALSLDEGETSEWIRTTYGWHLITVDSTSVEDLEKEDGFFSALSTHFPNAQRQMVWAMAQELNIDFKGNSEMEEQLKVFLKITEGE